LSFSLCPSLMFLLYQIATMFASFLTNSACLYRRIRDPFLCPLDHFCMSELSREFFSSAFPFLDFSSIALTFCFRPVRVSSPPHLSLVPCAVVFLFFCFPSTFSPRPDSRQVERLVVTILDLYDSSPYLWYPSSFSRAPYFSNPEHVKFFEFFITNNPREVK